jgi:hypothetical protein
MTWLVLLSVCSVPKNTYGFCVRGATRHTLRQNGISEMTTRSWSAIRDEFRVTTVRERDLSFAADRWRATLEFMRGNPIAFHDAHCFEQMFDDDIPHEVQKEQFIKLAHGSFLPILQDYFDNIRFDGRGDVSIRPVGYWRGQPIFEDDPNLRVYMTDAGFLMNKER